MNEPPKSQPGPGLPIVQGDRLDSWKKIAAHFKRDVTTVQRWERREGMPVHRHIHDKQGSVYAFRAELDAWWGSRRSQLRDSGDSTSDISEASPAQAATDEHSAERLPAQSTADRAPRRSIAAVLGRRVFIPILIAVVLAVCAAYWLEHRAHTPGRNSLANARFTRLTDWPGSEQAAEISRDGRWVAFLADHEGRIDAWLTRVGSGSYRNLTKDRPLELVNPSIRTLGFSADGSMVTVWTRRADGSGPDDVKLMAAPLAGGALQDLLPGVAEAAFAHDGRRMVYHTTAPGDPLFVRDGQKAVRLIYAAPHGIHCHFPLWSSDDEFIYFARGIPPGDWDIWRIRPSGSGLEQITFLHSKISHLAWLDRDTLIYLASDPQAAELGLFTLNPKERVPRRLNFGLERYSSIAADAGGARLVATVETSNSSIWAAQLHANPPAPEAQHVASAISLVSDAGSSPRAGPDYLLYLLERAGRPSIWKSVLRKTQELWSDPHTTAASAPAISRDGHQIAFTAVDGEQSVLYVMDSEGKGLRALSKSLVLRGDPAWAPDGSFVVCAVLRDGEPRLTSFFLDGRSPTPLVSEYSVDPVWSPDGRFLIYSGADVGTTFPVRAVARDGRPYPIPSLILTRGARRLVFLPDSQSIVVLRGEIAHKNFWSVDLRTGAELQLTDLAPDVVIRDFSLSQDGEAILFARVQATSRIALIERSEE